MIARYILILFISLVSVAVLARQKERPLVLSSTQGHYPLGAYLDIMEDKQAKLTITDVSKPGIAALFKKNSAEKPSFGYTSSAYWAKFTIQTTDYPQEWLLEISNPQLDRISLFVLDTTGRFIEKQQGDLFPFAQREIQHRNFIFRLHPPAGKLTTYYLCFQSESNMNFGMELWEPIAFASENNNSQFVLGLYYGIFAVMLVYNLFIFISLRENNYFYYILCILAITFFQVCFNGVSYQYIWPELIWWNNRATALSLGTFGVGLLVFSKEFLMTRTHLPRLHKFIVVLIWCGWGAAASALVIGYSFAIKTGTLLGLTICVTLIVTGILSLRQGFRPARYFLLAWSVFLVGGILAALRAFAVIPGNFWSIYSLQIGSALMVLLLSLGLADKINTLKRELLIKILEGERFELETESERKRMAEAQKEELERQVELRTRELTRKTDELKVALHEIEVSNKQIMDSIRYAKRIQDTIIPRMGEVKKLLPECFIFYRPRDIIGGDFYWIAHRDDFTIIAAADCTGHGVPGAFMSIIGSTLLDRIVNVNKVSQPSQVLKLMHEGVVRALKQDSMESKNAQDGMELAILKIESYPAKLTYAGAKIPLFRVKDGAVEEVMPDKFPIGGSQFKGRSHTYTDREFDIERGDVLYITSDGYLDQFGMDGRKFTRKRFSEMLLQLAVLSPDDQKHEFENIFHRWRGGHRQIDDVMVIGIKF